MQHIRRRIFSSLSPCLLFLGIAGSAPATVLFTEDFQSIQTTPESPCLCASERENGSYYGYLLPVTVPGWNVAGGGTMTFFGASGNNAVLLNEHNGGSTISRTLSGFTAGDNYVLGLEYWGDNGGNTYSFNILLNGNLLGSVSGTAPTTATGNFYVATFGFTAPGSSFTLAFSQTSQTPASPLIDNVSVSSVPEPSTLASLGGGLVLLGWVGRRRRS